MIKPEGIWACTVLGGKAGIVDGKTMVQINVRIEEGDAKGVRCTYEDEVTARSSKYVSRSLRAVGWQGQSLRTLEDDIKAWIAKTGGESTVEIKHLQVKTGRRAGEVWDKPNAIGKGAARPLAPLAGETLSDADAALREAMELDGGSAPAYPDDIPHPADSDDSIPF